MFCAVHCTTWRCLTIRAKIPGPLACILMKAWAGLQVPHDKPTDTGTLLLSGYVCGSRSLLPDDAIADLASSIFNMSCAPQKIALSGPEQGPKMERSLTNNRLCAARTFDGTTGHMQSPTRISSDFAA